MHHSVIDSIYFAPEPMTLAIRLELFSALRAHAISICDKTATRASIDIISAGTRITATLYPLCFNPDAFEQTDILDYLRAATSAERTGRRMLRIKSNMEYMKYVWL